MYKYALFSAAIIILLPLTVQSYAGELNIGKDLELQYNSGKKSATIEERIEMLEKPYDDIKISDGLSAGVISGREDFTTENKQRTPAKDKGREVGVGVSVSF